MRLALKLLLIAIVLTALASCGAGRRSEAGFRLPPDGDIENGRIAFAQFKCNSCHEVSGVVLPKPTVQPAVPVVLGGETVRVITDGYLVASIINPSHALAPY